MSGKEAITFVLVHFKEDLKMNDYFSNNNQIIVGIDPHEDVLGIVYLYNNTFLKSFSIPNCSKLHFDNLIADAKALALSKSSNVAFVIESTNVFWRPLFSYLTRKGFSVFTINSYQTNSSRKTKMRKTKTDLIDAKNIAELYLQGKAHHTQFPEGQLFDLRELTRFYFWLSDIKGRILNRIYAYMFQVFPEYYSVFPKKYFSKTLFYLLKHKLFHPQTLCKLDPDNLEDIIRKVSHDKYTNKVKQLVSLANNSTGISEGKKAFETTLKLLATFYQFLKTILNLMEVNSISPILETVPNKFSTIKGFSKIAQASFVSEIGNPKKFKCADDVLAFFGLDPSIGQSGRRKGQGKHISKAGSKFVRETMFLSASPVMFHNPVFKHRYQKLIKQGRHYIDAKTILAADLTKICFAMYRDNSAFDPNKVN